MTIKWIGSPNFDTNRTKIDTIFVHWIVGTLTSADAQFQKTGGTSAHYGIEDSVVHQYVKNEHVAYHAGVYSYNQRSIGIEHSASPDRLASDKTYETSGKLIAELCNTYGIPLDREHIKGHKEVRNTQCPGTMDIDRLIAIAKDQSTAMVTLPQAEVDKMREDRDHNWNLYGASQQELESVKKINAELNVDYDGVKRELNSYKAILQVFANLLGTKVTETEKMSGEISRLIGTQDLYNSLSRTNENLMESVAEFQKEVSTKATTISEKNVEIEDLKMSLEVCIADKKKKALTEFSRLERLLSLFI